MDGPTDTVTFLEKPADFVANLKKQTTSAGVMETVKSVHELLSLRRSADFLKCIEIARQHFDELFDHAI